MLGTKLHTPVSRIRNPHGLAAFQAIKLADNRRRHGHRFPHVVRAVAVGIAPAPGTAVLLYGPPRNKSFSANRACPHFFIHYSTIFPILKGPLDKDGLYALRIITAKFDVFFNFNIFRRRKSIVFSKTKPFSPKKPCLHQNRQGFFPFTASYFTVINS